MEVSLSPLEDALQRIQGIADADQGLLLGDYGFKTIKDALFDARRAADAMEQREDALRSKVKWARDWFERRSYYEEKNHMESSLAESEAFCGRTDLEPHRWHHWRRRPDGSYGDYDDEGVLVRCPGVTLDRPAS